MVRQKSSKKQRKSLAGDRRDADVASSRSRSVRPALTGKLHLGMATRTRAWACYGTAWQQLGRFRDVYSPRGAKKKVFLGTSSTVTLLEKNHARNVEEF